jgi:excisionase family DNA binding protein
MATKNETLSVKEAAAYLGKDAQYVRQLLNKGTLAGTKGTAAGTDIPQWRITRAACDEYQAKAAARGSGGATNAAGKAYKLRVPADKLQEVTELLAARGITLESAYASNYEYQKKRKARLRAEKLAAQGIVEGEQGPAAGLDEESQAELDGLLEDEGDEDELVEDEDEG